ncbi:TPA: helix-turn-helix transcriptional regulator [Enterobacter cloacae]|nr:helix-turn-helix transcriptional regulator [Enterobacter cloacae]
MDCSEYILTDDYYFKLGLISLLSSDFISDSLYIIDGDKIDVATDIKVKYLNERNAIVFVSNDVNYYCIYTSIQNKSFKFISKKRSVKDILSCVLLKDSPFEYKTKYILSKKELDVFSCMQKGCSVQDVAKKLNMKAKTIYTHRRSLINKLRVRNRMELYQGILNKKNYF